METKISLKQMVDNFIVEHKKISVNYLNDLQRKGTHMNHQERIKLALTSYSEHKWQIQAYGTEEAFREAALQLFAKKT